MRFEALGRETTQVTDWSIQSKYTQSTDVFSFTLYDSDLEKLRRLELQPVELLVDGHSQVLGRIDQTEIGDSGSTLKCSGRDYLADAKECSVDPTIKVVDGDTIDTVFLSVLSTVGIDTFFGDDDVGMRNVRSGIHVKTTKSAKRYANEILKEYKPKPGEGQYEFLNRLIARFGATIQTGPTRNSVVVTAPRYDQDPVAKIYRSADTTNSGANNIVSSSAVRDYSSFPTFTLFNGQATQNDSKGTPLTQINDTYTFAAGFMGSDSEVARVLAESSIGGRRLPNSGEDIGLGQLYRLLYFKDADARTQDQLNLAVSRAVAERLKDTLQYTVKLKGHTDPTSGAIWTVDTIVEVEDQICGIGEPLWVSERTLSYDNDGPMTQLTCYRPGSFLFGKT